MREHFQVQISKNQKRNFGEKNWYQNFRIWLLSAVKKLLIWCNVIMHRVDKLTCIQNYGWFRFKYCLCFPSSPNPWILCIFKKNLNRCLMNMYSICKWYSVCSVFPWLLFFYIPKSSSIDFCITDFKYTCILMYVK